MKIQSLTRPANRPASLKLSQNTKDNLITGAGAVGLFGGLGAGVGALLFDAPGAGALKGLAVMGVMLASSELMDNRWIDKNVMNWSDKCVRPDDSIRRGDFLVGANVATNACVLAGVGAAIGGVIGGTTGAMIGAGGIFAVGLVGIPLLNL